MQYFQYIPMGGHDNESKLHSQISTITSITEHDRSSMALYKSQVISSATLWRKAAGTKREPEKVISRVSHS